MITRNISKRELLFSIGIIFVSLALGFFIFSAIQDSANKNMEKFYKALKIDNDPEALEYAMDTNAGNAMVYGQFNVADPVSNDELIGEFSVIEITYQQYREHVETVYEYDDKGNVIGSHLRYYYSWDYYDTDVKKSQEVSFLGKTFSTNLIPLPSLNRVWINGETVQTLHANDGSYIYESGSAWNHRVGQIRYYYSVAPTSWEGTIMGYLGDSTIKPISGKQVEMWSSKIDDVIAGEEIVFNRLPIIFWFFWILITGIGVAVFYIHENQWLEK